jgi:hypothetical protein
MGWNGLVAYHELPVMSPGKPLTWKHIPDGIP